MEEKGEHLIGLKRTDKGSGEGKMNKKYSELRKDDDKETIGASSTVDAGSELESRHG